MTVESTKIKRNFLGEEGKKKKKRISQKEEMAPTKVPRRERVCCLRDTRKSPICQECGIWAWKMLEEREVGHGHEGPERWCVEIRDLVKAVGKPAAISKQDSHVADSTLQKEAYSDRNEETLEGDWLKGSSSVGMLRTRINRRQFYSCCFWARMARFITWAQN